MPSEECGLKGQHEHSGQLEFPRNRHKLTHQQVPDPAAGEARVDRDGTYLAQIGPENVQRTATHDDVVEFGDPELLDRFVQRDEVLLEQDSARVEVDELLDAGHVGRAGASNEGHRFLFGSGHGI